MLEFGPAMSPSGKTRPREHDANPNPWFFASGLSSLVGGKARESALTASEKKAKTDGANPSVASLDICRSAMSPSGNTSPWIFGPVASFAGAPGLGSKMPVRTRGFSPQVQLTRWQKLVRSRPRCTQKRVEHRRCQPVGSLVGHLGLRCSPLGTLVLASLGL